MSALDWIVLLGTLLFIVGYGVWKTRGKQDMEGYLRGGNQMKWWTIGLSVMATQASAITFLSTPGQAYEDGLRFIQFYFGLPLAMVVICITFIPIYYRLKVYTAYEYLESRFDLKTRQLAAFLFLVQRGLAAGITIYAPAIILSTILHWNLNLTILLIGILVIIYTVSGGSAAVSVTQKQQMAVMMGGMVIAGFVVVQLLPDHVSFGDAIDVAGYMGRLNAVDFTFDPETRYNVWSGLIGGFFLALSYFGTDQSQVARYLTGRSIAESRLGLLFNGLLKIPMQFLILFVGVLVFVFYQFTQPPVFFNEAVRGKVLQTAAAPELQKLEAEHTALFTQKQDKLNQLLQASKTGQPEAISAARANLETTTAGIKENRKQVLQLVEQQTSKSEAKDTDYVFISFIVKYLPHGIIGLLLAVIFCAAMSSTSSELNALASTAVVDVYKRTIKKEARDKHYVAASKLFTVGWGVLAITFAMLASLVDNLIQAVNILGSLFYGTILGIFLVAFYVKKITSRAVFVAALITEAIILTLYFTTEIAFLWFNLIGPALVIVLGLLIEMVQPARGKKQGNEG